MTNVLAPNEALFVTENTVEHRVARCFPQFMTKILIKNGQSGCFLKKVMAKNAKCFYYGNLYNHRELKMLRRHYPFAAKIWFGQESKFWP